MPNGYDTKLLAGCQPSLKKLCLFDEGNSQKKEAFGIFNGSSLSRIAGVGADDFVLENYVKKYKIQAPNYKQISNSKF